MNQVTDEIGNFDWLKQWSKFAPTKPAFKDADSGLVLSYAELFYLSCRLANHLRERFGVTAGDRVAMLATNEIEAVVLFFAIHRLSAILVPINFRLTAREIGHILSDSGAKLLVAQDQFESTLASMRPHDDEHGQRRSAIPEFHWRFEELQTFTASAIKEARSTPGTLSDSQVAQTNGFAYDSGAETRTTDWYLPLLAEATNPCMILYTSGTTGSPKGAMITPKMLHWNSLNTTLRLNLSQNDVFVSFLPFFHTGGWNVLLTPFVHRGACTVLAKKFDADRILELCATEKATIMFGVPTTMEMMSRSPLFKDVDLSTVRYAIVGGEPMPIELIRTWQTKGVPIRQGFGLTEFGPNVFSLNEEDAIRKIGSIGFANFYIETRIVETVADVDGNAIDRDVADGEVGELILRGPVCTPGYWKNEAATREAIVDGWFHTGDLVRRDSEGYFYVAGRKKDMFISGGENVYPVEVERVLSQHPAVREVAVIGVPDARWGEVGCAFVASKGVQHDADQFLAELVRYCSDKLAKYKIPKQLRLVPELPKGDSGKILKRTLRETTNPLQ